MISTDPHVAYTYHPFIYIRFVHVLKEQMGTGFSIRAKKSIESHRTIFVHFFIQTYLCIRHRITHCEHMVFRMDMNPLLPELRDQWRRKEMTIETHKMMTLIT